MPERSAAGRTVTYGGAVSLDGFLAGPGDNVDWLHFSKDVMDIMARSWEGVDTVLMGRKTWVASLALGGGKGEAKEGDAPPKTKTYVFSRTLKSIDRRGIELIDTDAVPFVRNLKSKPGGKILLMGGGELAQSLIAAGLVDEVGLNIHPILLGAGAPVFRDPGQRVKLTLTECRTIDGGCVLATYRVS